MGEARRRTLAKAIQAQPNGHAVLKPATRVRIVRHLMLQNVDTDHVTILMFGRSEREPELGMAFEPTEARQLAAALLEHAAALERAPSSRPLIISPGSTS